ncbi:hypothetical protein [Flavobacterium chilense]|uniref:Uncharacterized protein n=1 Tax=Flavobacterium chilense TaxID=946677 RepID=A0A1M7I7I5_9FLAO|nr:hypothetical protein [Flavobacterium chilense]SHM36742.1 hypothetical protein SAMN05444484_105309 [Flavobacterium chilense]
MIIKIGFSLFFLLLNFIIYLKINNKAISKNYLSLLLFGLILIVSNYYFQVLSNRLFFFLLIFSFGIFIMKYFSTFINALKKSELTDDEKVVTFKEMILKKVFPVLITIFQIVTIWFDKDFN